MTQFTPYTALGGGLLIGAAAVLLLYLNGRIAGISGILNGALAHQAGDTAWRVTFIYPVPSQRLAACIVPHRAPDDGGPARTRWPKRPAHVPCGVRKAPRPSLAGALWLNRGASGARLRGSQRRVRRRSVP